MQILGFTILMLASTASLAQMYSCKDPQSGATKLSNLPPPWYSVRGEVRGPRTTATVGGKLIDDTGLAYEKRMELLQSAQRNQGRARGSQGGGGPQLAGAKSQHAEKD